MTSQGVILWNFWLGMFYLFKLTRLIRLVYSDTVCPYSVVRILYVEHDSGCTASCTSLFGLLGCGGAVCRLSIAKLEFYVRCTLLALVLSVFALGVSSHVCAFTSDILDIC